MGDWKRRDVLRALGQVPLAAGFTVLVTACGGGGGSSSSGGDDGGSLSCDGGVVPTMDIHTHPTCLSMEDLDAGEEVTLTMTSGSTGHTHQVTLTAGQVAALQGGGTVEVPSTTNGHTHMVEFTTEV